MSTNQVNSGDTITIPAGTARVSGTAYLIGKLVVVAANTVDTTAAVTAFRRGTWTLAKATGQAWTQGALLYWDDTAKNFTTTSTSNTLAGFAAKAAASGDTTGDVVLNGGAQV